jgi:hypothetical protein
LPTREKPKEIKPGGKARFYGKSSNYLIDNGIISMPGLKKTNQRLDSCVHTQKQNGIVWYFCQLFRWLGNFTDQINFFPFICSDYHLSDARLFCKSMISFLLDLLISEVF